MENALDVQVLRSNCVLPYYATYMSFKLGEPAIHCYKCGEAFERGEHYLQMNGKKANRSLHPDCFWMYMRYGNSPITVGAVGGIDHLQDWHQLSLVSAIQRYNSRRKSNPKTAVSLLFEEQDPEDPESGLREAPQKVVIWSRVRIVRDEKATICAQCKQVIDANETAFAQNEHVQHFKCILYDVDAMIGDVVLCEKFFYLATENEQAQLKRMYHEHFKTRQLYTPNLYEFQEDRRVLILSTVKAIYSREACEFCESTQSDYRLSVDGTVWHPKCLFTGCVVIFEQPDQIIGWSDLPIKEQAYVSAMYHYAIYVKNVEAMNFKVLSGLVRKGRAEEDFSRDDALLFGELAREREEQLGRTMVFWEFLEIYGSEEYIVPQLPPSLSVPEDFRTLCKIYMDQVFYGEAGKCPKCHDGDLVYNDLLRVHRCNGSVSPFTACSFTTQEPRNTNKRVFVEKEETPQKISKRIGADFLFVKNECESFIWTDIKFPDEIMLLNGNVFMIDEDHLRYKEVLISRKVKYEALLTHVDVECNHNLSMEMFIKQSCGEYVVELLAKRIGTDIVARRMSSFARMKDAIECYKEAFHQYTGYAWASRMQFVKLAGKFFHLKTKIPEHFRTDLDQYPEGTGRLVRELTPGFAKQKKRIASILEYFGAPTDLLMNKARRTLDELKTMIENETATNENVVDASNIFYSIIPTNVGFMELELLDDVAKVDNAIQRLMEAQNFGKINLQEFSAGFYRTSIWAVRSFGSRLKLVPNEARCRDWINSYIQLATEMPNDCEFQPETSYQLFSYDDTTKFVKNSTTTWLWYGAARYEELLPILRGGIRSSNEYGSINWLGSGIYFSEGYTECFEASRSQDRRVPHYLLLCEVTLGKNETVTSFPTKERQNELRSLEFDSVKWTGRYEAPIQEIIDGSALPVGPLEDNGAGAAYFDFDQHVVFSPDLVRIRYVLGAYPSVEKLIKYRKQTL